MTNDYTVNVVSDHIIEVVCGEARPIRVMFTSLDLSLDEKKERAVAEAKRRLGQADNPEV